MGKASQGRSLVIATGLGLLTLGALQPTAEAGGWSNSAAGATRVGMSAVVAKTDNADAVYHNVANLGLRDGSELYISVLFGYATATAKLLQGIDDDGNDWYSERVSPKINYSAFPLFAFASDFGLERWRFAVANYLPNLSGGSLDENGPARYNIVQGYFVTNYLSFAGSYKVSDQLLVGLSLDTIYARQEGYQKISLFNLAPPPLNQQFKDVSDLRAKRLVEDFTFSYHFGLLYQPHPNVRMGMSYFEHVPLELDGTLNIKTSNNEVVLGLSDFTVDTTLEMMVPRTIRFGMNFVINEKWNWGWDLYWWDYSKWDYQTNELHGLQDSPIGRTISLFLPAVSKTRKHYTDSFEVSAGVEHILNDRWKLRFGVQYDESPIPNATFTLDSITNDQWGVAAGFDHKLNDRHALAVGFQHRNLWVRDIKDSVTNPKTNVKIIQSFADSIVLEWRHTW